MLGAAFEGCRCGRVPGSSTRAWARWALGGSPREIPKTEPWEGGKEGGLVGSTRGRPRVSDEDVS